MKSCSAMQWICTLCWMDEHASDQTCQRKETGTQLVSTNTTGPRASPSFSSDQLWSLNRVTLLPAGSACTAVGDGMADHCFIMAGSGELQHAKSHHTPTRQHSSALHSPPGLSGPAQPAAPTCTAKCQSATHTKMGRESAQHAGPSWQHGSTGRSPAPGEECAVDHVSSTPLCIAGAAASHECAPHPAADEQLPRGQGVGVLRECKAEQPEVRRQRQQQQQQCTWQCIMQGRGTSPC